MRTSRIIAAAVAAGVVGAGAVVTPIVLAADGDDSTEDRSSDDSTMPYGPRWADEDDMPGRMGDPGQMRRNWQDGEWAPGNGTPGQGHGMARGGGPGPGMGNGMGPGMAGGGMGPGGGQRGEGGCLLDEDGTAQGTLTQAQEADLLAQVEHEKVARDVYRAFFDSTGDYRFDRVAASEQHHLDALRMLVDRYDLSDPTKGLAEGEFGTDAFQEEYDAYLEQGKDLDGALAAAQQIETDDIADLKGSAKGLDAPDVERVYEQQVVASEHHLAAFSR